jgi:hypothetical protein
VAREAKATADRIAAQQEAAVKAAREEAARLRAEAEAIAFEAARQASNEAALRDVVTDARPTQAKYALLLAALHTIAAWGDELHEADEPHAAAKARVALAAVGVTGPAPVLSTE